jgi:hypothetical protein
MEANPYKGLPASAFWKTGVAQEDPYFIRGIYEKKYEISVNAKIAIAGSCFAQHVFCQLKKNGYNVLDLEPAPPELPQSLHQKFGFSIYSARYGNIYTVQQLLQLVQEVSGERCPQNYIWERQGRFYDALRPAVEPEGLDSPGEVIEHRRYHLAHVKQMFESLDVFFFTFGLTEMWVHKESGTVYPTAPGTMIGEFDPNLFEFINVRHDEVLRDFNHFQSVLTTLRGGRPYKILLTVSPVPLTATASGKHVLVSTAYSKSTLRSVAGQLSMEQDHIDYFPSYEIVANPKLHSTAFSKNLRSITGEAVDNVMSHFFAAHNHPDISKSQKKARDEGESLQESLHSQEFNSLQSLDVSCEEMILDSFAPLR